MVQAADTVRLTKDTLQAHAHYLEESEAGMKRTLDGDGPFLWCDTPERDQQVRQGQTIAEFWSGSRPVNVPEGLIHDWIGATRVPLANIKQTLALIQDYDNHKNIYKSEVIDSRLIKHRGNDYKIYLRLLKKKIVTVVLDTDHDVHYSSIDSRRWCCRSATTRISEVEDAGKTNERVLPPDTGYGFLWRLNSYWRFHQRDNAVFIECRAISLTRDVPRGLGWVIDPIIRKLPRESLVNTLESTRRALVAGEAQH